MSAPIALSSPVHALLRHGVRLGMTVFVLGLWLAVWWAFVLPMRSDAGPIRPVLSDDGRSVEP